MKGTPQLWDFKLKVVSLNPDQCEFSILKNIWDSFIMLTLVIYNETLMRNRYLVYLQFFEFEELLTHVLDV